MKTFHSKILIFFLFLKQLGQFIHIKQTISCKMLSAREQNGQVYRKMESSVLEILNCLEKIILNDGMWFSSH